MQIDAINLVPFEENTTTTTKKRKFLKIPEMFAHDGDGCRVGRRYKTSWRRWSGTLLSLYVAKLPWQKEFQHFVPLSKQEKEAPHDRTTRCCFFTFFSPSFGTICIHFFREFVFVAREKKKILQEKWFCWEIKRNKIESTRQILEYLAPNDFHMNRVGTKKLCYWRSMFGRQRRKKWKKETRKSKETSFEGKEKHVTHRLWATLLLQFFCHSMVENEIKQELLNTT